MSKGTSKRHEKNTAAAAPKKAARQKRISPLPIAAAVVAAAVIVVALMPKLLGGDQGTGTPVKAGDGENIEISVDSLSPTASLYDYDAEGVTVELMALRDTAGQVRLALNTCQVCAGSPYAYFIQEGDSFICQNCGNVFPLELVGVDTASENSCNPVPVTGDVYTIEDGILTVPAAFLEANAYRFVNWKKF